MIEEIHSDIEKPIYTYNYLTKEYEGSSISPIDIVKSYQMNKNQYYRAGSSTFIAPPEITMPNQIAVFDESLLIWNIVSDFRGYQYTINGETITITTIDTVVPEGATDIIPAAPKSFVKPQYVNGEWIETQLFYKGYQVDTKEDVDLITTGLIVSLEEEKAKSEKLIAGDGPCEIWDTFVINRAAILAEGNAFKLANNLV
jgi:hypothetical protein